MACLLLVTVSHWCDKSCTETMLSRSSSSIIFIHSCRNHTSGHYNVNCGNTATTYMKSSNYILMKWLANGVCTYTWIPLDGKWGYFWKITLKWNAHGGIFTMECAKGFSELRNHPNFLQKSSPNPPFTWVLVLFICKTFLLLTHHLRLAMML